MSKSSLRFHKATASCLETAFLCIKRPFQNKRMQLKHILCSPQSTSTVLGERDQEPTVCVRHP